MKQKRYRNTAFLVELMINVCVLCIACAVLVGVFVESYLTVSGTSRQSAAGNEVYALLQTAKVYGLEGLEGEAGHSGCLALAYNSDWQRVPLSEAHYTIELYSEQEPTTSGTLETLTAIAFDGEEEICRFDTAVYRPEGGGG